MRSIYVNEFWRKYIRRFFKREALLIQIVILIAVLAFFFGRAFGEEPEPVTTTTTTTTTSTTTTVAPTTTTTVPVTTSPPTTAKPPETKPAPVKTVPPEGSWQERCHRWATQAGIDLPPAAINLIERESKCDPTIRNPSSSAGGIAQALPWTKMGCPLEWTDEAAVCQLKWMHGYVMGRYSSWENAWATFLSRSPNWY